MKRLKKITLWIMFLWICSIQTWASSFDEGNEIQMVLDEMLQELSHVHQIYELQRHDLNTAVLTSTSYSNLKLHRRFCCNYWLKRMPYKHNT